MADWIRRPRACASRFSRPSNASRARRRGSPARAERRTRYWASTTSRRGPRPPGRCLRAWRESIPEWRGLAACGRGTCTRESTSGMLLDTGDAAPGVDHHAVGRDTGDLEPLSAEPPADGAYLPAGRREAVAKLGRREVARVSRTLGVGHRIVEAVEPVLVPPTQNDRELEVPARLADRRSLGCVTGNAPAERGSGAGACGVARRDRNRECDRQGANGQRHPDSGPWSSASSQAASLSRLGDVLERPPGRLRLLVVVEETGARAERAPAGSVGRVAPAEPEGMPQVPPAVIALEDRERSPSVTASGPSAPC